MKRSSRGSKKSSRPTPGNGRRHLSLGIGRRPDPTVVNAVDRQDLPMQPTFDGSPLSEIPTDWVDIVPSRVMEEAPDERVHDAAHAVDLWKEIRLRLTPREYQVFEFTYRYQMRYDDVMSIMNIKPSSYYKHLSKAMAKLRRTAKKRAI